MVSSSTSTEPETPATVTDEKVDVYEVSLEPEDDPKNVSTARKWLAVAIISLGSLCVTCASSMAAFGEDQIAKEFNTPTEVNILGISLYVFALGNGTLLIGPLSEIYGRRVLYQSSFLLFWIFSWPVAFAPNIAVYLVFRYLTGFCSAAFFCVAGGTVADLFLNSQVGPPMALYSLSPFIGPVLGPLLAGFINQNTTWRWMYRLTLVWSFVTLVGLCLFVPETYAPLILKKKAQRLRKSTGEDRYWAPLEREPKSVIRNIAVSSGKCFAIMYRETMAVLLDLWMALISGILYLTFQVFPIIFGEVHGLDTQMVGLCFLGLGIGMVIACCTQPLWDRFNARMMQKHAGNPPPEARLIMGQVGGVLIPIGLFWLAFTTYKQVHWIVPIIACVPFGAGVYFTFNSVLTYLVVAYRPVAASAMAGNAFLRSLLALAFPLIAGYMYDRLGTVGATALLAGLTALMAPLPFIFYKIGARVRATSRYALAG